MGLGFTYLLTQINENLLHFLSVLCNQYVLPSNYKENTKRLCKYKIFVYMVTRKNQNNIRKQIHTTYANYVNNIKDFLCSFNLGTPTSLLYTGTETELSHSMHQSFKECANTTSLPLGHELVPIVTMGDNSSAVLMPEMLDSLPQPMQLINPSSIGPPCMVSSILTGVYTLPEEPELEAEENTSM